MAVLDTVGKYITECRALLQDSVVPYRYSDADIIGALNLGLAEAYRLRPDLFLNGYTFELPFLAISTDPIPVEPQYRSAFSYYIVGRLSLRDEEDTQDARASSLLNKFVGQMLSITS